MTQPTETPNASPRKIQGQPMPLEELLEIAEIDADDVESAAEWWDEYASEDWIGALDVEPTEGNVIADE